MTEMLCSLYQITSEVLDSLHTRCSLTEKLDLSWSGPYEAISSDSIIR